jgi:hypothetical protein
LNGSFSFKDINPDALLSQPGSREKAVCPAKGIFLPHKKSAAFPSVGCGALHSKKTDHS